MLSSNMIQLSRLLHAGSGRAGRKWNGVICKAWKKPIFEAGSWDLAPRAEALRVLLAACCELRRRHAGASVIDHEKCRSCTRQRSV